jgi:peptidoglycan/LPS O-acetylase OafA/YrhL
MGSTVLFGGAFALLAAAVGPHGINWWLVAVAGAAAVTGLWAMYREFEDGWQRELWDFRLALWGFMTALEGVSAGLLRDERAVSFAPHGIEQFERADRPVSDAL